jgi:hypothetical protein
MKGCVYFIRPVGALGPVKIGHANNPHERLRDCQAHSPVALEIAAILPVAETGKRVMQLHMERRFHIKYADSRLHHEWFAATPELLADIGAVNGGTFDAESLPKPSWTRAAA